MTAIPAIQIPLDFGHRVALDREDFLVAPCNRDAVGWIDRWPGWPAPALVLYGLPASGKTHLAAVWKNGSEAAWIDASVLANRDAHALAALSRHLVIDHLDSWIGHRAAETALFHLYNLMKERGSSLLITMRAAPGQIKFTLPDLASRLRAAPAVAIAPPDDTLLAAVLVKLFADRQLQIGADLLAYILPRMERSFAAARDLVAQADRLALAEKKAVSIPLIRRVLSADPV
ncbi:MAG TPA: DnaA/Hda family protein [Micavibrio sp.]